MITSTIDEIRGLLFDLDGVLIDSRLPILGSLNHALTELGLTKISLDEVAPLIGPPLENIAARLLQSTDAELIRSFIALYRDHYARVSSTQTRPAKGLTDVLAWCASRWPIALATSKPEVYARPILKRLGIDHLFHAVCGRSLDLDAEPKALVVARAAEALGGAHGLLMVGDRKHDVVGAAENGILTIGVLHGAGTEEELREAGARWIVQDLPALVALLDSLAEPTLEQDIPGRD